MKALRSILGLIRKADQKFDFFHENDKIMIGVSGGKDSMLLLYALNQYKQFKCANFEIVPAILDFSYVGNSMRLILNLYALQQDSISNDIL